MTIKHLLQESNSKKKIIITFIEWIWGFWIGGWVWGACD